MRRREDCGWIGAIMHAPGAVQPGSNTPPHNPLLVSSGEEVKLFGKQGDRLAVGTGQAREVGAPEDPLRTKRLHHAAHVRV